LLPGSPAIDAGNDSVCPATEQLGAPRRGLCDIGAVEFYDDVLPSVSVSDVTVTEGNSGTVNAVFTVALSGPAGQVVTVNFAMENDTATAASDYVSKSETLTFKPGETSKNITVLVNGDTANEPNETFFVNLSNASNATIEDRAWA
jgi:hypothetical protein